MPTRLITTSLPRKCSLSCASSYTSPFSSVRPGSTNKCLCCSRSRDRAVTRWPSLIRRASRRVPRNPVPPKMQIDRGFMGSISSVHRIHGSSYGNQENRRSTPYVEHQHVGAFGRLPKTLGIRHGGAPDADDQVVGL